MRAPGPPTPSAPPPPLSAASAPRVKQQRVDLDQRLLTQQQLQHPIDDRRRRADQQPPSPPRPAASGRRRDRRARSPSRARSSSGDSSRRCVASATRSLTKMAGGRADARSSSARSKTAACPRANSCSRSSSRGIPSDSGCAPVMRGQRLRRSHPSGACRSASDTSTSPARTTLPGARRALERGIDVPRVDAGARRQRGEREAGRPGVVDHHGDARCSAPTRSLEAGSNVSARSAPAPPPFESPSAADADRESARRRSSPAASTRAGCSGRRARAPPAIRAAAGRTRGRRRDRRD